MGWCLALSSVKAQYTWLPATGGNWSATGSWDAAGIPTGSGVTITLGKAGGTVLLDVANAPTISRLNIGGTGTGYILEASSGTNVLTFTNGAVLQRSATASLVETISAGIRLNGELFVDTLITTTFTARALDLTGDISDTGPGVTNGGLTKRGNGRLNLSGTLSSDNFKFLQGATTVLGRPASVTSSAVPFQLNVDHLYGGYLASLILDNSGANGGLSSRIKDTAVIHLNGSTFQVKSDVNTGIDIFESIGGLHVQSGYNVVTTNHTEATNAKIISINLGSYDRDAGGVVAFAESAAGTGYFSSVDPSQGKSQFLLDGLPSDHFYGAADPLNFKTASVLVGAYGALTGSGAANRFMTVEETNGDGIYYIRALMDSEFRDVVSNTILTAPLASPDENVNVKGNYTIRIGANQDSASAAYGQLAGEVSYNSWWQSVGGTVTVAENNVVHMGGFAGSAHQDATDGSGSGMMLFDGITTLRGGTFDFGGREAVLRTVGSVTFMSRLVGANGLTKSGAGTLELHGWNDYSGPVTVVQGTLNAFTSSALGASGPGNGVKVENAAKLYLHSGVNIGDFTDEPSNGKDLILGISGSDALGVTDQVNVWNGNVYSDAVYDSGYRESQYAGISIKDNGVLIINGGLSGLSAAMGGTDLANGAGQRAFIFFGNLSSLATDTAVAARTSAANKNMVFKVNGELSDVDGGVAAIAGDSLLMYLYGDHGSATYVNNRVNIFIEDGTKTRGSLYMRDGYVHFADGYGTAASTTTLMHNPSGGNPNAGMISALLLGNDGAAHRSSSFVFGGGNVDTTSNSVTMMGGENTTGTVTFGNAGTPGNGTSTTNFSSVGGLNISYVVVSGASGSRTITLNKVTALQIGLGVSGTNIPVGTVITAIDPATNTITLSAATTGALTANAVVAVPISSTGTTGGTTGYSIRSGAATGSTKLVLHSTTGLVIGTSIKNATGIPVGTIITAINGDEITLSNALTANPGRLEVERVANFAEVRLYQREGGSSEYLMRFDDGGLGTMAGRVGAITKVGRGTAVSMGTTSSNHLTGGVNVMGGALVFTYGGKDAGYSHVSGLVGTQNLAHQLTMAGGELRLENAGALASVVENVENIRGNLSLRAGNSTIVGRAEGETTNIRLNLGLVNTSNTTWRAPDRYAGATLNFFDDSRDGRVATFYYSENAPTGGAGDITDANRLGEGAAIPYSTFKYYNPAGDLMVDMAAFKSETGPIRITTLGDGVSGATDYEQTSADLGQWTSHVGGAESNGYLTDAGLGGSSGYDAATTLVANHGTDFVGARIVRFGAADDSTITIGTGTRLVMGTDYFSEEPALHGVPVQDGGAILVSSAVGAHNQLITGGEITSALLSDYFSGPPVTAVPTAAASTGNVLTLDAADAEKLTVGMTVTGPGIVQGTFITNISGGTVTLSVGVKGTVNATNELEFRSYATVAGNETSNTIKPWSAYSSRDLILHNYNTEGIFTVESRIVDYTAPANVLDVGPSRLNLVVSGPGVTHLTNGTNSYTGTTFVSGGGMNAVTGMPDVGTLWISHEDRLGAVPAEFNPSSIYLNGGRLRFAADTAPETTSLGELVLNANRGITLGGNGGHIDVTHEDTVLQYDGIIRTEDNILSGNVAANQMAANTGVGDLIKEGTGRLILTNSTSMNLYPLEPLPGPLSSQYVTWNAYYGMTEVRSGALEVWIDTANSGILGSNDTTIDGTIVREPGRLDFKITGGTNGSHGSKEWIILDGGTLGTVAGHVDGSLNGVITITDDGGTFDIQEGTLRLNTESGYFGGTGAVRKTGAGTLVIFDNAAELKGANATWEILQGAVIGRSQGLPLGNGPSITLGDAALDAITTAGLFLQSRTTGKGPGFVLNFTTQYVVEQDITVAAGTQIKELGATNGVAGNGTVANSGNTGQNQDSYIYNGDVVLNGSDLRLVYRDDGNNTALTAPVGTTNPQGTQQTGEYRNILLNGGISGSGDISTLVDLTASGTGVARVTFALNGDNSGWSGDLAAGNVVFSNREQHVVRLGHDKALTSANDVSLGYNSTFQVGGQTEDGWNVTIGNLTLLDGVADGGNATTDQIIVENASNATGTLTVTQTKATATDWNILFRDGVAPEFYSEATTVAGQHVLNLVKEGSGTAVFTQLNSYTGYTAVNEGVLQVGKGGTGTRASAALVGRTGAGGVQVNAGGILAGTGVVQGASTTQHEVNAGGVLAPGDNGGASLGSLFVDGSLALNDGGTIQIQIAQATFNMSGLMNPTDTATYATALSELPDHAGMDLAITTAQHDYLEIDGEFDLSGGGHIEILDAGYAGVAGDVFRVYGLLDWSGLIAGSFHVGDNIRTGGEGGTDLLLPTLNNGLVWDTSLFLDYGVLVVTAPEPGRALLLVGGMAFALMRRRRRTV